MQSLQCVRTAYRDANDGRRSEHQQTTRTVQADQYNGTVQRVGYGTGSDVFHTPDSESHGSHDLRNTLYGASATTALEDSLHQESLWSGGDTTSAMPPLVQHTPTVFNAFSMDSQRVLNAFGTIFPQGFDETLPGIVDLPATPFG